MKKIILITLLCSSFSLFSQLKVGSNVKTIHSNANLQVESVSGNQFVVTKDSSKVGVGVKVPTAKLHIIDTTNYTPLKIVGLASGNITTDSMLVINPLTNIVKRVSPSFLASGAEPWYNVATGSGATSNTQNIYQMGKVGIGTTSPTTILDVIGAGTTGSSSSVQLMLRDAGAGNAIMGLNTTGVRVGWFGLDRATSTMYWNNDGTGSLNALSSAKMVLTSAGNVGIGTTNPSWLLDVQSNANAATYVAQFANMNAGTSAEAQIGIGAGVGTWAKIVGYNGALGIRNYTSGAEWLTVKNVNGYIGLGNTNPGYQFTMNGSQPVLAYLSTSNQDPNGVLTIDVPNTNSTSNLVNSEFIEFYKGGAATLLGLICMNSSGNGVMYNTTSDIRLKENIQESRFGLNDLMKLNVVDYNYKTDEQKNVETGFIAQELYRILPNVVRKGTEELKENGLPKDPWMVDYAKLTPLVIKAAQDLKKENDELLKLLQKQTILVNDLVKRIETLELKNK